MKFKHIFSYGTTAKIGHTQPLFEVSKSHTDTHTHTHPVGVLWISDRLVAETTTYATHNKHKRRTPMPSVGFEPAIPAIKRPQNYALDRTATGIGSSGPLPDINKEEVRSQNTNSLSTRT
jgi:hypothetical protein